MDKLLTYIIEKDVVLRNFLRATFSENISKRIKIHYHTVNSWLKEMEIETRLPHQKLLDMIEIKRKLEVKKE